MLSVEQQKRLDRMRREPLYLIDARASDDTLHYRISGSTGNVYDVTIGHTLRCSCPDASSGARRHSVLCKHCCFVVHRVLGESVTTMSVWSQPRNRIGGQQFNEWQHVTCSLPQFVHDESPAAVLIPEPVRHRFSDELPAVGGAASASVIRRTANGGGARSARVGASIVVSSDPWTSDVAWRAAAGIVLVSDYDALAPGAETQCAVCFDDLVARQHTHLVRCGTCNKCLHRTCADQWIRAGDHDYCVYCRSDLAYAAVLVELDDQHCTPQKRRRVRR